MEYRREMPSIENNLRKLTWIKVLKSTQFQAVIWTIFLLSKGFTLAQIFLMGSVYAAAAMLSEIPTGSFSDRIGRKNSLLLSTLIELPATLVVILSGSLWVVTAMSVLFGIASSFTSGTDTAMLYDTLDELGRTSEFKKVSGYLRWLGAWGGAIGGIVGGVLAKFSLAYACWAWVAALTMVFLVKLLLTEPSVHKEATRDMRFGSHFGRSLKLSFRGEASYFVLYYVFVWLFFWIGYSLWQPYLKLTGLPVAYFGFFYAGISLVSGFASRQAHRVERRIGMRTSLFLIPLVLATAFFLEYRFVTTLGFLFIGVQGLASGYFAPVLDDYVNTRIPSEVRATVLSVQSMGSQLAFTIVSPLIGYFADWYSLPAAFGLIGGIVAVLALAFGLFPVRPFGEEMASEIASVPVA